MRTRAFSLVVLSYIAALAVAAVVVLMLSAETPIVRALWADVAATCVVFGFSRAYNNSSFYDAYWSVAPVPIAIYWMLVPEASSADPLRQLVVVTLVSVWAVRLTFNWGRGWSGLDHEDWRYVDQRENTGSLYWGVSLVGLHMMPTLLVFGGCLALWPALATGTQPFGAIDILAAGITGCAILLESTADKQLRRFRLSQPAPEEILQTGVWAYCRHPNYLGEIGFWWGLYFFALAADPQAWWTGGGALAITLLFRFVSLKLIDDRMLARRPDYKARMDTVPALLPGLRRG
ncbi:MAG: steroid 5-alpha reductase family enzyme [Myxococcota bacterium]|jgi:steroid 5-alpha reductase family enzyme